MTLYAEQKLLYMQADICKSIERIGNNKFKDHAANDKYGLLGSNNASELYIYTLPIIVTPSFCTADPKALPLSFSQPATLKCWSCTVKIYSA